MQTTLWMTCFFTMSSPKCKWRRVRKERAELLASEKQNNCMTFESMLWSHTTELPSDFRRQMQGSVGLSLKENDNISPGYVARFDPIMIFRVSFEGEWRTISPQNVASLFGKTNCAWLSSILSKRMAQHISAHSQYYQLIGEKNLGPPPKQCMTFEYTLKENDTILLHNMFTVRRKNPLVFWQKTKETFNRNNGIPRRTARMASSTSGTADYNLNYTHCRLLNAYLCYFHFEL